MTRLTLTFDNGPDPRTTPGVLAALADRGLPATFFVVGDQLQRSDGLALADAIVAAGHRLGNHSMTHAVPLGHLDDAQAVAEIRDAAAVIGERAGDDKLFRPFGGGGFIGRHLLSPAAADALIDDGYTVALWNCVPRDWEDPTGWPARAMDQIETDEWTVLVLHDLPTGAMDALPAFLDDVVARGVDVVADLPDRCVPIRRGAVQWPFAHLVAIPA